VDKDYGKSSELANALHTLDGHFPEVRHELDPQLLRLPASLAWAGIEGGDGLLADMEGTMHGEYLVSGQLCERSILLACGLGVEKSRIAFDLKQCQAWRGIDNGLQQASDHVLCVNEARSVGLHEGCIAPNISDHE
jgi:hypothetical protein